jgi:hypothetical protein
MLSNISHDIIIVGDFNNNQLNNNTNNKTRSLLTQYSFYQLIDEPTYITEHSKQGGLSFLIEIIILGIMSLAMSVIVCLILYVMESIS